MTFDLGKAVADANAAYFGHPHDCTCWNRCLKIPAFLLAPTSGTCEVCGHYTEEKVDGDWCHEGCHEESVREQESDNRYNNRGRI